MGLKNLRILLLKVTKLSAFQMARSSLFHSVIADGKKVFLQGNTINISHSIRKCKKPSIFEHFLVVESFFWSNYRLIVQSSDYILKWLHQECFLGNLPLELFRPSTTIHFRKFIQKIPVMESFFWLNYRLAVQSSDYIPKWLHQECFLGNLPKDFGVPKYHRL